MFIISSMFIILHNPFSFFIIIHELSVEKDISLLSFMNSVWRQAFLSNQPWTSNIYLIKKMLWNDRVVFQGNK